MVYGFCTFWILLLVYWRYPNCLTHCGLIVFPNFSKSFHHPQKTGVSQNPRKIVQTPDKRRDTDLGWSSLFDLLGRCMSLYMLVWQYGTSINRLIILFSSMLAYFHIFSLQKCHTTWGVLPIFPKQKPVDPRQPNPSRPALRWGRNPPWLGAWPAILERINPGLKTTIINLTINNNYNSY